MRFSALPPVRRSVPLWRRGSMAHGSLLRYIRDRPNSPYTSEAATHRSGAYATAHRPSRNQIRTFYRTVLVRTHSLSVNAQRSPHPLSDSLLLLARFGASFGDDMHSSADPGGKTEIDDNDARLERNPLPVPTDLPGTTTLDLIPFRCSGPAMTCSNAQSVTKLFTWPLSCASHAMLSARYSLTKCHSTVR